MEKNKKIIIGIMLFVLFIIVLATSDSLKKVSSTYKNNNAKINYNDTFKIISSQENKELEGIIRNYARSKNYNVDIEYAGTLEITQKLNDGEDYDAAWLSNSIWSYMIDSKVPLKDSKCTSINPVVFGIKESKAKELGFVGKEIKTQDILNAISSGKLKFSMSNPTTTNSGASAYLGLLSTIAGNPEVLKKEDLEKEDVKNKLIQTFGGIERTSGDEDFLETLFLNGNYEAVFTYESSIININKELKAQGKETLYAVYPVDGVSISDSPFAYIDNKNESKKEIFEDLQNYLLSNEGQKKLQEKGRRTWYGGVTTTADKDIFNPAWGIDTTKYISPIKFPNSNVIKLALNLYQNELRKPVHTVFCLDYSGSMYGEGYKELKEAMEYILTEKAASDFIQFSDKDKIDVIKFEDEARDPWSTNSGKNTTELLTNIRTAKPSGLTALYPACVKALEVLKNEDSTKYNPSIVLMTDGAGNIGKYSDVSTKYNEINKNIPIYSIMFGDAVENQLNQLARLTNAKVFDGKKDLVKAFREVRGYN